MSEHYCQHRRLKATCPACSVERAVAELRAELDGRDPSSANKRERGI